MAVEDRLARFLIDPERATVTRQITTDEAGYVLTATVEVPHTPLVGVAPARTLRGQASTAWYGSP